MEFAVFILVVGLSTLCFYYPKLLSKNIKEELSTGKRIWFTLLSLVGVVGLYVLIQPNLNSAWVQFLFAILFLYIALVDGYSTIIPNRLLIGLLAASILLFQQKPEVLALFSAGIIFLGLSGVNLLVSKIKAVQAFGWGDVKLLTIIALAVGTNAFLILAAAIMIGGITGMVLLGISPENRAKKLPFGLLLFLGFLPIQFSPIISVFKKYMGL